MDYTKYIEKAKEIYKDEPTGHDFGHIERVLNYCKHLQTIEGGNEFVIIVSALFHDVHRILSSKQQRFVSAEESKVQVEEILKSFVIDESQLKQILYCIQQHDNKKAKIYMPIELQILQDADILDSLGEIGLNRCLTYCKKNNIPLTNKNYDLDCNEYVPDLNPISSCHYIYRTMIPNSLLLHTKTAQEIGKNKVKILQDFVENQLSKEKENEN